MSISIPPEELVTSSITINYHETATNSITDLTGTKWLILDAFEDLEFFNATYALTFTSGNTSFSSFKGEIIAGPPEDRFNLYYNQILVYYSEGVGNPESWEDQSYRTISITGGTDATNTDLISWLQANATQIIEPPANTYELTHSLTHLSHGNITIQITPDTGYTYPSNIAVTNGTLVSYDSGTGVAVISGDDTTIISATCAENTLINFSINLNSTLYSLQAEANMTWAEFANSSYNENNSVVISGSSICYLGIRNQVYSDINLTNLVDATDTITADTTYYAGQGA